ncbi:unnamed protein product, partial [Rotaria magnacalcarata]
DNSQQQQQQRGLTPSNRLRSTMPNVQVEIPHINETFTKERANAGKLIDLNFSYILISSFFSA